MELLLLVVAIVVLGVWVGWQEYRITKIREELDRNSDSLKEHEHILYGTPPMPAFISRLYGVTPGSDPDPGIIKRVKRLENAASQQKHDSEERSRKEEMAEYISSFNHMPSLSDDDAADILYRIAHGEEEDK